MLVVSLPRYDSSKNEVSKPTLTPQQHSSSQNRVSFLTRFDFWRGTAVNVIRDAGRVAVVACFAPADPEPCEALVFSYVGSLSKTEPYLFGSPV